MVLPRVGQTNDNPYLQLLYGSVGVEKIDLVEPDLSVLRSGAVDIAHFHWPEQIVGRGNAIDQLNRLTRLLVSLMIAKRRGVAIAWTVHNAEPHENKNQWITRLLYGGFARLSDHVFFMSNAARTEAVKRNRLLRGAKYSVVPHGHYRDAYSPSELSLAEARAQLGLPIDGRIALMIGRVRRYKNIPEIAATFVGAALPNAHLVIAGLAPDDRLRRQISEIAERSTSVHFHPGTIDADDITTWLQACDVVLVPYEILNSGSAMLALSFGRPVVTVDNAITRELRDTYGLPSWLRLAPANSEAQVAAMNDVLNDHPTRSPDLSQLSWQRIGEQTFAVYQGLINIGTSKVVAHD